MRFRLNLKTGVWLLLITLFAPLASMVIAEQWINKDSAPHLYTELDSLPTRKVGLVLGCAKNIYFYHRIRAACDLYNAGKIRFILVSGDNHIKTYDETTAMKTALIQRGIPEDHIICDYAGFSTIDSVVRAKVVFKQHEITIISQPFHVRRALFIAKRKQIDAVGYCAPDVTVRIGARTQLRETFARVKTILDLYLLHRKPRFLGPPIQIGNPDPSPITSPPNKACAGLSENV